MKIFASILAVIAILALRPVLSDWFRSSLTAAVSANPASCVSMLGNTTNEQDGATYIVGTIRNKCEHPIGSVTVIFKLERGYGPNSPWHEGFAQAYARDVAPGETRKFKSAMPVSKNSIVRFDKINAF
jgi:hypothetical protein